MAIVTVGAKVLSEIFSSSSQIAPGILVILGVFVGVISGLLGVGGGVLMTPALHLLGLSIPAAVGTTLTQMVASSLSGTFKHYTQQNVSFPLVFAFGIPGVLGVVVGKEFMLLASRDVNSESYLSLAYGCFLILIAIAMVRRQFRVEVASRKKKRRSFGPFWSPQDGRYKLYLLPSITFGLVIGVVSGLTGLGGGFFYMPVMSQVMGIPLKVAVGSSLGIVVLSSLMGAVVYGLEGVAQIPMAINIAVGSVVGSFVGASATQYVEGKTLKLYFSFLVLVAAISMIIKFFGYHNFSFYLLFFASVSLFIAALVNASWNYLRRA